MTITPFKPHWSYWIIAFVVLLWTAGSGLDYVMIQTANSEYLGQMTDVQRAFFAGFPSWVQATWAIAVWSAVLGALLLLILSRWSVLAFWLSLLAMLVTTFHNFWLAEVTMGDAFGSFATTSTIVMLFVGLLLAAYARTQARIGLFRR